MRLLFVSNYYPPYEIGGYEQLCRDVAESLRGRGHDLLVLTSDYGTHRAHGVSEKGVCRGLRLHIAYKARTPIPVQFVWRRPYVARHDLRLFRRCSAEFRPNVICFWNTECLPRELAVEAETRTDTGVVYWLAGRPPSAPDEYERYWQTTGRSTAARAFKGAFGTPALAWCTRRAHSRQLQMQHVGVVSAYLRQAELAAGTISDAAEVIPNGVEVEEYFGPVVAGPLFDLRLILAGRVAPDKGVHVAIEALAQVVAGITEAHVRLTIAGAGPEEYVRELRRAVDKHDLGQRVEFAGKVPRSDMPAVLGQHHVLLLPTLVEEAFARVVLEAMAAGLAVVAADTGGTSERLSTKKRGSYAHRETAQPSQSRSCGWSGSQSCELHWRQTASAAC